MHGERALHHCIKSSSLSLSTVCVWPCQCVLLLLCIHTNNHALVVVIVVVVVVVVVRALWQHEDRQRMLCVCCVCDGWLQTHMLQRCYIATKAGIVECDWWHGFQSHALVVLHLSVLCCAAKCCGKQDHVCTEQHTQIARVCVCARRFVCLSCEHHNNNNAGEQQRDAHTGDACTHNQQSTINNQQACTACVCVCVCVCW